jgi:hypothetical protein
MGQIERGIIYLMETSGRAKRQEDDNCMGVLSPSRPAEDVRFRSQVQLVF